MLLLFWNNSTGIIPNIIDTGTYSQHPVNCIMEGNGPTIKDRYRTVEWAHGKGSTKTTASTGGARRLSKDAPSFSSVTRKGRYLD